MNIAKSYSAPLTDKINIGSMSCVPEKRLRSNEEETPDEKTKREFDALKVNWRKFIVKFESTAPKVFKAKRNVFVNLISGERSMSHMVEMARGTRPFISRQIYELLGTFMESMKNLPGIEGENYSKVYDGMSADDLIKRLLFKRPIVFFKGTDDYVLRHLPTPKLFKGKGTSWYNVAKTLEETVEGLPFLQEYISYDEMLLSALVGISTPTYFVSDGSLKDPLSSPVKPYVKEGVLCALIGARLKKESLMENRFVMPKNDSKKKPSDNVHLNDLFWIQKVYAEAFPEGKIPTQSDIDKNPKLYEKIYRNGANVVFLEKRLMFSVVPFLIEACNRGFEHKKQIVASIPGIGAGVWRGKLPAAVIHEVIVRGVLKYIDQNFDQSLKKLSGLYLPVVDTKVYSSYVMKKCLNHIRVNQFTNEITLSFEGSDHKLTIFNKMRYVADPLPRGFEDCFVVASYAFDSNSYPGNNYWVDSFSSFDPQAMICSLLGQFQNPEVNVDFANCDRIKVY